MSYLEQVTEQITGNTDIQEKSVETPAETKTEPKEEPKVEPKVETKEETKTEPKDEPKVETKAETPAEKPDLSKLTKEEKAEHAFKRQLAKQREKYENQIKQMHDTFQKQFDDFRSEFKKSQPKEPPKQRKDFDTDDEYIKYLVKSQNDAERAELAEKNAKEAEEKAAKEREERAYAEQRQQLTDTFQRNCRAAFQDEESYGSFAAKVNKGLANGLGELLDQAPAIRDYLFSNQNGPTVLNEMLSNKASFIRIMQTAGNPMEAAIEMHELARELKQKAAAPVETHVETKAEPPKQMPHIGKPGAKSGGARTSVFGSEKDLINFIRSR